MSTVQSSRLQAGPGSTLRTMEDYPRDVYYDENVQGSELLRVHFRISRFSTEPGRFTMRHFHDANQQDRRHALEWAARPHDLKALFATAAARGVLARRRWNGDRRRWVESLLMGRALPDPLVQLELEMMIEASRFGQDSTAGLTSLGVAA